MKDLLYVVHPSADGVNTCRINSGVSLYEFRVSSSVGFRAFKFIAPKYYNSLPLHIRMVNDISKFKNCLKTFLFSECYDLGDATINESYRV